MGQLTTSTSPKPLLREDARTKTGTASTTQPGATRTGSRICARSLAVLVALAAGVVALLDASTLTAPASGTGITIIAEQRMCRPSASVRVAFAGRRAHEATLISSPSRRRACDKHILSLFSCSVVP